MPDAYDFAFAAPDGAPLPLADFRGRALIVANTASECGFAGQYETLQRIWERHRDAGLTVIGVPSNDFAGQEPIEDGAMVSVCAERFHVDFPLAAKAHVRGKQAHPFFQWIGESLGWAARPKWNFHKYVIGRDGRAVDWFSPLTPPDAPKMTRAIDRALSDV